MQTNQNKWYCENKHCVTYMHTNEQLVETIDIYIINISMIM